MRQFAEPGDSGSLVITHDGNAVGAIVGVYEITSVILMIDEQGVINLNYLREFRQEDRSVHLEDCYTQRLFDEYELVIDCYFQFYLLKTF